jgi:hypothetical protein
LNESSDARRRDTIGAGASLHPPDAAILLEDSGRDRPCYCEFLHPLTELFFQRKLLFFVKTKTEDPELIQRFFREVDLMKLKTDLFFYFSALLRGQLNLYKIFH